MTSKARITIANAIKENGSHTITVIPDDVNQKPYDLRFDNVDEECCEIESLEDEATILI